MFRNFFVKTKCPHCGHLFDTHMAMTDDCRPSEGDISVCIDCAEFSEYDSDGDLRIVADEEKKEYVRNDPEVIALQKAIRLVNKHRV